MNHALTRTGMAQCNSAGGFAEDGATGAAEQAASGGGAEAVEVGAEQGPGKVV